MGLYFNYALHGAGYGRLRRVHGRVANTGFSLLGVRFANGQGVAQDDAEAVRYYRLAAEQGHARAQWQPRLLL
jgi:TPR repeat protein